MTLLPFYVLAAILSGLAGVGLAVLVAASPIPTRWPRKPFVCRTCLSGWGSIGASFVLLLCADTPLFFDGAAQALPVSAALSWAPWAPWFLWLVLSLAGTGIAHLLLGLAGEKTAPPPLPAFNAEDDEF